MSKKTANVLIVLDGWGHSDDPADNAIAIAKTPVWDSLWSEKPHTLISGSGFDVGLPDGQMGNSEVGHMNLGAGRVVDQDFTRISKAIVDGSFFDNGRLKQTFAHLRDSNRALHIFGLLSDGGVHSHEDHIHALVKMAQQLEVPNIFMHAFLDGRDVPPRSAEPSLTKLQTLMAQSGDGIATITGRFYAMDRDNRWDRVQAAYQLVAHGQAEHHYADPVTALNAAYDRDESDEFVAPTVTMRDKATAMVDGDAVVFMNFRADRAREITRAFVDEEFVHFDRNPVPQLSAYLTLTEYAADIDTPCIYPPLSLSNGLGEFASNQGLTQLRLAETEKYAHVTFFFSGGREEPFTGEDRILIPSPDVRTYDLQPSMSAAEVTDELTKAIREGKHDLVICNYANGDMVGHTGNLAAAVQAVECLDECLGRIVDALNETGGRCLITADHGNVEKMSDHTTGQAHTAHTSLPVPLVLVGADNAEFIEGGTLSDVAPTLLALMGISQPQEMTGHVLLKSPVTGAVATNA